VHLDVTTADGETEILELGRPRVYAPPAG
jgi:hypothetical protein